MPLSFLWQNRKPVPDASRLLVAGGLTIWLGALLGAITYVSRRMRFPKSMYARNLAGPSRWVGSIAGFVLFAATAFSAPTVAWVFTLFTTGFVIYGTGAYVMALRVERRRATRLGAPEPGTAGTISFAENAVFLAIAVPCALTALALTVYGIANEIGGNRGEGGAGAGAGSRGLVHNLFHGAFRQPSATPSLAPLERQMLDGNESLPPPTD